MTDLTTGAQARFHTESSCAIEAGAYAYRFSTESPFNVGERR